MTAFTDITIERSGNIATIVIQRPPHNFFDMPLIQQIAAALEGFDKEIDVRAIVLASEGKSFCAGANFGDGSRLDAKGNRPDEATANNSGHLYQEAVRIFRARKPIIAAVQGPAIGGGLGLAVWHTIGMFVAAGTVAVIVYEVAGVTILRRAWFNVDRMWAAALIAAGVITLLQA